MRYHDLAKRVDMTLPASSLYLVSGDVGLTEDLIDGFTRLYRRTAISEFKELIAALDEITDRRRAIVVRDAHRLLNRANTEAVLLRLDREKRNERLMVVFTGEEPADRSREWFEKARSYGEVTEPTFEAMGRWAATKTADKFDYRKVPKNALIDEATGYRLMEHVGWDYTAAIQAARTIRAYAMEVNEWPLVSALVPRKMGFGYAEELVFGGNRRKALMLSQGIVGSETWRSLGLIRYYLLQFAKLRAVGAEKLSDRAVSEQTGIHVWRWKGKFKPAYPRYTNDRIRFRLELVERLITQKPPAAVLEVLAAEW